VEDKLGTEAETHEAAEAQVTPEPSAEASSVEPSSAEASAAGSDATVTEEDTTGGAEESGSTESEAVTGDGAIEAASQGAEEDPSAEAETSEELESDAADDGNVTKDAAPADVVEVLERVRRPRPEQAKIDKCVKEWQIGSKRANQLVQWLCDPFGDSDSTGDPPAVLSTMPSIKALKPGDAVVGVVVGVMPFGVFVELAPDCSGLVHVSRVSDTYVEDLHEAVQVGDVVSAWVTGIDEKRRRVALSGVSPQREAELAEVRRSRDDRSRGGQGRGGQGRGGQGRGGQARGGGQGGQARGGGQGGQARGGGRGRDQGRGGRSRDGGRGRGARGRDKKPESYRVVGKKETKPISDAMQKGEEPLRSFGDLMQFYNPAAGGEEAKPDQPGKKKKKTDNSNVDSEAPASNSASSAEDASQTADSNSSAEATLSNDVTAPQSAEAASPTEPAPPVADQEGSDSSPASDKPTS
ncbi:MAG: S1 RNA-binding domain-containing protein, partial [Rubripirellula sp.]